MEVLIGKKKTCEWHFTGWCSYSAERRESARLVWIKKAVAGWSIAILLKLVLPLKRKFLGYIVLILNVKSTHQYFCAVAIAQRSSGVSRKKSGSVHFPPSLFLIHLNIFEPMSFFWTQKIFELPTDYSRRLEADRGRRKGRIANAGVEGVEK